MRRVRWTCWFWLGLGLVFGMAGCERTPDIKNPKTFQYQGISYQYPGNWTSTLDTSSESNGILSFTIESTGSALMILQWYDKRYQSMKFETLLQSYRKGRNEMLKKAGRWLAAISDSRWKPIRTEIATRFPLGRQEVFQMRVLSETVPHVSTYYQIRTPKGFLFLISQVATEDFRKVKPGFQLVWKQLRLSALRSVPD